MNNIAHKEEWDFIVNETHNGDKDNRIKREILFILQGELSKPNPNMDFYKWQKDNYLSLDFETCNQVNSFINKYENLIYT